MGSELELGTFCHENGHMLCDYPDLYDYGYESSASAPSALMGSGNNRDEKNPISICAYLKRLAPDGPPPSSNWNNDPRGVAGGRHHDFAIFPRNGREYFIIENRQRANRAAPCRTKGWRSGTSTRTATNSNQEMTAAKHYEISLEQADGLFQLERVRGTDGDANDLYAGAAARLLGCEPPPTADWWSGALLEPDHRPHLGLGPDHELPGGGPPTSRRLRPCSRRSPPPPARSPTMTSTAFPTGSSSTRTCRFSPSASTSTSRTPTAGTCR
jgi:hypothetical protein